jgi:hypothetical protein
METAKVDIRKLQLLNDRINQCIDALNQVRLSVHGLSQGLSHTSPQSGIGAGSPYGFGFQGAGASPFTNPLTQAGVNPFGLGPTGLGQPGQIPMTPGFTPGLSHSSFAQGANPYLAAQGPESLEASMRPIWADPVLTARIVQTFPYAQFPVPPVVTIY